MRTDQRRRRDRTRPLLGHAAGQLAVGRDHDDRSPDRLRLDQLADQVVGDHARRTETDSDAPRRLHRRRVDQVGAVEDHRHLGRFAGRQPVDSLDEARALLVERKGRPGRLGHVVAVHDQVNPWHVEQSLQQGRVVIQQCPPSAPARVGDWSARRRATVSAGSSSDGGSASSRRSPPPPRSWSRAAAEDASPRRRGRRGSPAWPRSCPTRARRPGPQSAYLCLGRAHARLGAACLASAASALGRSRRRRAPA